MAIALLSLLTLSICASPASAAPLSMTFTEARANVGIQLSDAPLFAAPDTAPFEAQIDPASGAITGGLLQVPEFETHVTGLFEGDVSVDFEIGPITGIADPASGALTLKGEAGGVLASEGKECTVSTEPTELVVSTTGSSGGTNPRSGTPFTAGLSGAGAIAGEWTDMHAAPVGADTSFCNNVEGRIGGAGGVWLEQKDIVPPPAPQLTGTKPDSPGSSGTPRILGSAESGSKVRVYAGGSCAGAPVATGGAAELGSAGIVVEVTEGATVAFSATATDAAGNTSPCSAPISYTHVSSCVVPKLRGKSLRHARAALKAAHCRVGKVHKPRHRRGRGLRRLVVKSSKPSAGTILDAGSRVDLKLGPRPRKARR